MPFMSKMGRLASMSCLTEEGGRTIQEEERGASQQSFCLLPPGHLLLLPDKHHSPPHLVHLLTPLPQPFHTKQQYFIQPLTEEQTYQPAPRFWLPETSWQHSRQCRTQSCPPGHCPSCTSCPCALCAHTHLQQPGRT